MKLLLDANLSWRIVKPLTAYYSEVFHSEFVVAEMASDQSIWSYANENNCIIVTNDEDFLNLVNINGFPPKVVLLKTGNQSNSYIKDLLISKKNEIEEMFNSAQFGILELF
jgi:predicted nuclease of predicted toxin-antitoxin system